MSRIRHEQKTVVPRFRDRITVIVGKTTATVLEQSKVVERVARFARIGRGRRAGEAEVVRTIVYPQFSLSTIHSFLCNFRGIPSLCSCKRFALSLGAYSLTLFQLLLLHLYSPAFSFAFCLFCFVLSPTCAPPFAPRFRRNHRYGSLPKQYVPRIAYRSRNPLPLPCSSYSVVYLSASSTGVIR